MKRKRYLLLVLIRYLHKGFWNEYTRSGQDEQWLRLTRKSSPTPAKSGWQADAISSGHFLALLANGACVLFLFFLFTSTIDFWVLRGFKCKLVVIGQSCAFTLMFKGLIAMMNNLAFRTTWDLMPVSCSWHFWIKYIKERAFSVEAFFKHL